MHQNTYWIGFLSLIALCVSGYTIYTGIKLYDYSRLTYSLSPQQVDWSVVKMEADTFIPHVHYQFSFKSKTYSGSTEWQTHYLNEWAAREAIKRLKQQTLPIWIDPFSPAHSTIQKTFPLKPTLYMALLWALLVYFIGLGRYMMRFKN
jgi:hypothetical protein